MDKQNTPSFIGFILSDKDGRKIEIVEIFEGAFKEFLKMDEDGSELELIPMFVSAMEKFSTAIHFSDLSNFTLKNSHIKMQIFPFEFFTVAFFVKKELDLEDYLLEIRKFFQSLYRRFQMVFIQFKETGYFKTNEKILSQGKKWLLELNNYFVSIQLNQIEETL